MSTLRIKPAAGLTVLNPEREMRPLDPAGEEVPATVYWHRRLKDGDVVLSDTPAPAAGDAAPAPRTKSKT